MRIPSVSTRQRSIILLSSSAPIFEYMEKRGPELSRNWGPDVSREWIPGLSRKWSPELSRKWSPPELPRGVWNDTERGRPEFPIPIHGDKSWRAHGMQWGTYHLHSPIRQLLVDLLPGTLKQCGEFRTPRVLLDDILAGNQQREKHAASMKSRP